MEVTKTVDEGRTLVIVYMNFSKAFDKDLHGRLRWMVRSHVIHGELANTYRIGFMT